MWSRHKIPRAADNTGRVKRSKSAVIKMAQENKGNTPKLRPGKRMFPMVAKKLREDKKDETPDTSKPSMMRSTATGDKLIREVLKGG